LNPTKPIPFSLANKAAIVTGGCSAIGLASARRFCKPGMRVLIADRQHDGGPTAGWMEYDVIPPANVQKGRWVDAA
jgi:NAD(P)-dependent dehydrogenase (short-subunit alcohol dehydrogenase family)